MHRCLKHGSWFQEAQDLVKETDIHKEVERKAGSIKFYNSKKFKCYVGRGSQGGLEVNTEAIVGLMPDVC